MDRSLLLFVLLLLGPTIAIVLYRNWPEGKPGSLDRSSIQDSELLACVNHIDSYIQAAYQWESNLPRKDLQFPAGAEHLQERFRELASAQNPNAFKVVDTAAAKSTFAPLAADFWVGSEWAREVTFFPTPAKHNPETELVEDVQRIAKDAIEVITGISEPFHRTSDRNRSQRIYRLERGAASGPWRIRRYFANDVNHPENPPPQVPSPPMELTDPRRPPIPTKIVSVTKSAVRVATRLRPYPDVNVSASSSNLGGPFLNNGDNWPRCDEHNTPMIGILQLLRDDVSQLPFRDSEHVFQMFWCPYHHGDDYCPLVRIRWLDKESVKATGSENPETRRALFEWRPCKCRLFPHEIDEVAALGWRNYQTEASEAIEWLEASSDYQLSRENLAKFANGDLDSLEVTLHNLLLGPTAGTKIGGYPNWIQGDATPTCQHCAKEMNHLLTVASWEWDQTGKHVLLRPPEFPEGITPNLTGMMLGDVGAIYVFYCSHCDDRPIRRVFQCH